MYLHTDRKIAGNSENMPQPDRNKGEKLRIGTMALRAEQSDKNQRWGIMRSGDKLST